MLLLTVKRKKGSKSEAKGTVSKVTGKKITKIIGLGKKKPSTDEQTSSAEEDVPTCGEPGAAQLREAVVFVLMEVFAGGWDDPRLLQESSPRPSGL